MAVGVGLILQPWWAGGFRVGFLAAAIFTLLHVATSHLNKPEITWASCNSANCF